MCGCTEANCQAVNAVQESSCGLIAKNQCDAIFNLFDYIFELCRISGRCPKGAWRIRDAGYEVAQDGSLDGVIDVLGKGACVFERAQISHPHGDDPDYISIKVDQWAARIT